MNDNVNSTAKWMKYLLYVGIASAVNYLLGNTLLGNISRWVGYVLNAGTIYLLFRLIGGNARYKTAALFAAGALVCNLLGIQALTLAASVCAIVAQYQEYHAHGELIAEQDPKLAGKWGSLFWLQFAVELIAGLLIGMAAAALASAGGLESAPLIAMATVAAALVTLVLKVLYLVYLMRTVKLLEAE